MGRDMLYGSKVHMVDRLQMGRAQEAVHSPQKWEFSIHGHRQK